MRCYNLHILGISGSRWTGSGRYRTNTGQTVLYSGRDDDQHHGGPNSERNINILACCCCCQPKENNGEVPDGMEADDQQADQDHNEGEACQHHLVLCTYQWQWGEEQGCILWPVTSPAREHTMPWVEDSDEQLEWEVTTQTTIEP